MDYDLIFVTGALLLIVAVPSFLSALLDRNMPRLSVVLIIAGGCMVGFAVISQPGAYTLRTLPDVLINIAARVL